MKAIIAFLGLLCSFTVLSQDGDYFLTSYAPGLPNIEHVYFDLDFTSRGELVVANKSGVLRFDGDEWDFFSTPSSVLSVAIGSDDNIFVGCAGEYGQIVPAAEGLKFQSLRKDTTDQIVYQVLSYGQKIYFLEDNQLTIYYEETGDQLVLTVPDTIILNQVFEFDSTVYVQSRGSIWKIDNADLVRTKPFLPGGEDVEICRSNNYGYEYGILTTAGTVYTYDGRYRRKRVSDDLLVSDLVWTSPGKFGISTYANGILFFDKTEEDLIGEITGGKGLPDNEIFAITSDDRGGLWVANSFGFSRVAPEIPIRSFNYFPGIEGNLTSIIEDGEYRLVTTSTGIYYFDTEKKYRNRVYYVPKSAPVKPKQITRPQESRKRKGLNLKGLLPAKQKDQQDRSNGLLSGIFQGNEDGVFSKIFKGSGQEFERKVRQELVSTRYLYKPIEGIHEKVNQLIRFSGKEYMAATSSGVIEIIDKEAHEIYTGPNRYIFHPENTDFLVISTFDRGLVTLESEDELWVETHQLQISGDVVIKIYQDRHNRYWGAGAHNLFEFTLTDSSMQIENRYPIENQFFDDIEITELSNKLYLVNTLGYFYLDEEAGVVKRDHELEKYGIPQKHLQQSDHKIWVNNGENWFRIEEEGTTDYTYLKLFPEMSFIEEVDGHLWIIDDHRNLFRYVPSESDSIPSSEMYYKTIWSSEGLVTEDVNNLELEYNTNTVQVDLARPDYLGLLNIEYQYMLEGRSKSWSEWTSSSRLEFPFLPSGEYRLLVRSRDTFGRIQESEPISIKVNPPYWETGWFGALEVIFFSSLVFGSARLNRKTRSKYSILTSLLTVLTVVLIIEFLQNAAGSFVGNVGTPVLAFGIDVLVALFVFPIEQLLKRIVQGKPKAQNGDTSKSIGTITNP